MYNFNFNTIAKSFQLKFNYNRFFTTSNVIIKFIVKNKLFFTTTTIRFKFRYFNKKNSHFIVVIIRFVLFTLFFLFISLLILLNILFYLLTLNRTSKSNVALQVLQLNNFLFKLYITSIKKLFKNFNFNFFNAAKTK